MDPELIKKRDEYEARKARTKALLALKTCTICGADKAKACQGCGTTAYCSTECQRIDWRDRGHRKACKKIRDERAAEAARAGAPTPPPPPKEVFYGPAPRSHADEVRARIAAEHEAARARREANPEPEPFSARMGARCPVCHEDWDLNQEPNLRVCCCRMICQSCGDSIQKRREHRCPLCRAPIAQNNEQALAQIRRHVENEIPEAIAALGHAYHSGDLGLVKSSKKAAKLYKRSVELGSVDAMINLGHMYTYGDGVKRDMKKASQLNLMAADRGHPTAQNNHGHNLSKAGDKEGGVRYFRLSAEAGFAMGQYNLGYAYQHGEGGLERDIEEAVRLYVHAAAKGCQEAIHALDELGILDVIRDSLHDRAGDDA